MAAQHFDVGVHGAVLAVIIVIPHLLQNFLAGQRDALVGHKEHQQVKFLGRQRCLLPSHLDAVAGGINDQIAKSVHRIFVFRVGHGARQNGPHSGHQLPGGEGLDHVIVRAALQPGQLVVFLAPGGQHDDRRGNAAGSHLPQAGHAVHEGHHDVQDHQIDAALRQCRQRRGTVAGLLAGVTRVLQILPDQIPDARLIVHDQNFCHTAPLLFLYNTTLQDNRGNFVKVF